MFIRGNSGSLNFVVSSGVLVRLPSISVLLLRTNIQSLAYSGSECSVWMITEEPEHGCFVLTFKSNAPLYPGGILIDFDI
jgi:hypothetical protein